MRCVPFCLIAGLVRHVDLSAGGGRSARWCRWAARPPAVSLLLISVRTVERHRADLLRKLGLRDRLEVTRYAIRAGLTDP
ncbi:hypothetical protein GCM10027072_12130 [Streptomyces bullii]